MDNIFSSNISQRSEEGNIGKNQWNIFKKFCLWAAAAAVISFIIVQIINGIYYLFNLSEISFFDARNVIYLLQTIFFIIISIAAIFKFFYYGDKGVNHLVKRKADFYNTVYNILSKKYSFSNEELAKLKIQNTGFEDKCRLNSYYLVPIGLFGPLVLLLVFCLIIIVAEYSLYNGISGNSIIFVFLLSILIFILCFIIPAKKRMSIWYIINTNEKEIVDEISRLLMSKNIIENPLRLDIDNKFQKPYLLLVIMSIIMPALYFVVEIDNTNAEKKYLKMIYPVEDKLLEILEY